MRPASLQAPVVRDHIFFSTVDAAFWVQPPSAGFKHYVHRRTMFIIFRLFPPISLPNLKAVLWILIKAFVCHVVLLGSDFTSAVEPLTVSRIQIPSR